ncbi:hypothetical protein [Tessaracoccus sp. ZS01]|uniref:hypothetical protein n=1 Tax=Tessaracoccus sp. ZS01 TaxID=1906324 RepID=UPI00117EBCE8|nr:hypothetical protein [Tessaracoccus sp. ZS01]
MTRGRSHNHVYVPVVGTGDEHTAFRPETLRPPTAIDMLDAILARDGTARSVTTQLRDATAPAVLLPDAVNRYRDAITVALEHHHAAALDSLDRDANTLLPGLTDCDAWPTLRQRLLTSTDTGDTPIGTLHRIATGYRWNDGIRDPAALLASLLPEHSGGPLPWLPPIPQILRDDECWGPYLQARADRVATIAAQVRADALQAPLPPWLPAKDHIPAKTIADVHVWRAAEAIPDTDRRPTGEPLQAGAARRHQIQLDQQLVPSVPTFGVAQLRLLGQGVADDPTTADLAPAGPPRSTWLPRDRTHLRSTPSGPAAFRTSRRRAHLAYRRARQECHQSRPGRRRRAALAALGRASQSHVDRHTAVARHPRTPAKPSATRNRHRQPDPPPAGQICR